MYIIGNKHDFSDTYINISNAEFIKILVSKLTKGLIKNTDESACSHLYCKMDNPDKSAMIYSKFF
jgi:hypothetical protein